MIVYNVTVNIDDRVHDEWLEWMRAEHIPQVLATGLFIGQRMFRILSRYEGETGTTYSIQYYLANMDDYESYAHTHAPGLQKDTADRYEGRFTAFRTLLEEI